ncbi:purple acid phosphatase family protein [Paenibacillus aurantiacus]|uniref:Purple acid phosphatase family protein n=1 Tax=Paenibacillus aurantiacus TaxID=1936118 RepID=A0ABV5KNG0_9BACL
MRHQNIALVAVLAAIVLAIILFMLWDQKDGESNMPESLVTTFHDDARTSRAFTWFTNNPKAGTVIQLVEGKATNAAFDGGSRSIIARTGTTQPLAESGKQQGVHKVNVMDLKPDTLYTYRVGTGEDGEWSEPAQFTTAPVATDAFTFLNVTDSQGVSEADFKLWGNTLSRAFDVFPDSRFIVHNGDFTENPKDENAWRAFFASAGGILPSVPLMPVAGNHDEVEGNAEQFVSHFNTPSNGAAGSIPGTTYSFDFGSAHIVVLNTESNLKGQVDWLRKDLAFTDKPWKIVALHRGPYGGNSYKKLDKWVDVFDQFQVDLVLQGHNHEYSRSYPLRGGKTVGNGDSPVQNREGTVYVVANTAGPKFNEKKEDQFYHKVHFQNSKQMFAGITIKGDSLVYEAYDVDGVKLDSFEIRH